MKPTEKEKLCFNCEGRIPRHADICPFCGTDQTINKVQNSFQAPLFQTQSLKDSLTSLYTPPYQGKRPQFTQPSLPVEEVSEPEPTPDHSMYRDVTHKHPMKDPLIGATVENDTPSSSPSSLWPVIFLITGVNLLILGLMQVLFAKNGILHLEWDASYWFIYCLLSAVLLFLGIKKLRSF